VNQSRISPEQARFKRYTMRGKLGMANPLFHIYYPGEGVIIISTGNLEAMAGIEADSRLQALQGIQLHQGIAQSLRFLQNRNHQVVAYTMGAMGGLYIQALHLTNSLSR